MSYRNAIEKVGRWSRENFGDQNGVGPFAPLAGISEEIAELEVAIDFEEQEDALCDILIFMADLLYRSGVAIDVDFDACETAVPSLVVASGTVSRILLKRNQGIRGYDRDDYFECLLTDACEGLFYSVLARYGCISTGSLEPAFNRILDKVLKRNWKANPEDAHKKT